MSIPKEELEVAGFEKVYDYSQFAHENNINVIPKDDFARLVADTFKTLANILRETYGPYGSSMVVTDQNLTTVTKDGFNVFESLGFSHSYKHMVYLAIANIIRRVNRNVGDGTTSCILLADKIFNNLNQKITTADQRRNILKILNIFETQMQNPDAIEQGKIDGTIYDLDMYSLKNLIMMASNYDEELTDNVIKAIDPEYTPLNFVKDIRQVQLKEDVTYDVNCATEYVITPLEGDYRIGVSAEVDDVVFFSQQRKCKCLVYDHKFGEEDWQYLMHAIEYYNNPEEHYIVIARSLDTNWGGSIWVPYKAQTRNAVRFGKGDGIVRIHFMSILSDTVQNDIADLATILNCEVFRLHHGDFNMDDQPDVNVNIVNEDCLCFNDLIVDEEAVNAKIQEFEKMLRSDQIKASYIKQNEVKKRIANLKRNVRESILTVRTSTPLEAKLIKDKIDDCVSIANSALSYGIVGNLLNYASQRICDIVDEACDTITDVDEDEIYNVGHILTDAISGLFIDVFKSKRNVTEDDDLTNLCTMFYSESKSFDIVSEEFKSIEDFPTSVQYDIEVVVAAISIVKYLITANGFIFDAHLLPNVNDRGHYEKR